MGIFDRLFKVDSSKVKDLKLSREEAFLTIVLSAVACDEEFAPEEIGAMFHSLARMVVFQSIPDERRKELINKFIAFIRREGVGTMITLAKSHLDEKMLETAFALAVDIVLADGVVKPKEKEFLEQLQEAVGFSDKHAEQIVNVMVIKNRGAGQDWYRFDEKSKHLYG